MPATAGHHRRHRSSRTSFGAAAAPPTPWLVAATDLGLLGSLILVPGCLGGRTPGGHLVLVLVATWTACCWSLHRLTAAETRWTWTRTEWLWIAALALVAVQLSELPPAWLDWLSPQHAELLGTAEFRAGDEVLWQPWGRLSLSPNETQSGLATFLAYGMLFFIGVQRLHERRDVERALKAIALVTVGWAAFSLLHHLLGNGRFFWVIVHPQVSTTDYNTGPFITRNHFAHFLALGSGPLLWWWLKSPADDSGSQRSSAKGFSPAASLIDWRQIAFAAALTVVVVASVLTLSRGGLAAMGIAMFVTLFALNRTGHVTTQFVLSLSVAGVMIGGLSWLGGAEALTKRIDSNGPELRYQIWQANIELARAFPWFGTGIGTHATSHRLFVDLSDRDQIFTHAESSYLQVASECGAAGLVLAAVMSCLVLSWPLRVLFSAADRHERAMAAAVLGSLVAHLLHATVDFLWYAPGCMVVIVLLAAIGRRLSQLSHGTETATWALPRLCWGLATAASLAVGLWMTQAKLPAARAEGSITTFRLLSKQLQDATVAEDPEEVARLQRERSRNALRTFQTDPHAAPWASIASVQYLKLFDLKQQQSESPMSLVQIRDAVNSSEWESAAKAQDWIGRVTGANQRWLDAAWKAALSAIHDDPLEGPAYLHLARLSFLKDPSGELQRRLIERALKVRPHDPDILISAGEEAALQGDLPQAIKYWQAAFPRGKEYQQRIARILTPTQSPAEIAKQFQPDWRACLVICDAYAAAGRAEERQLMLRELVNTAVDTARKTHDSSSVSAWITACIALQELGEGDRAVAVLREAAERDPNQFDIRRALGGSLFQLERYAEAAEHLRWAAARRPGDVGLRQAAEVAIRESHRGSVPQRAFVTPVGLQQSWTSPQE
ncbi:MAG: O-antigen ligase family protein [Planctomycetaceae bacterium]|nr:O-antigen ligase family protein [Planctomycetaceae bacterium]